MKHSKCFLLLLLHLWVTQLLLPAVASYQDQPAFLVQPKSRGQNREPPQQQQPKSELNGVQSWSYPKTAEMKEAPSVSRYFIGPGGLGPNWKSHDQPKGYGESNGHHAEERQAYGRPPDSGHQLGPGHQPGPGHSNSHHQHENHHEPEGHQHGLDNYAQHHQHQQEMVENGGPNDGPHDEVIFEPGPDQEEAVHIDETHGGQPSQLETSQALVPGELQASASETFPSAIGPQPLPNSPPGHTETTSYVSNDNHDVINDIKGVSITDTSSDHGYGYGDHAPVHDHYHHYHKKPCPKVKKIEKVIYKYKKIKVPVPMIVKKSIYPIKVMVPYKKKPKHYSHYKKPYPKKKKYSYKIKVHPKKYGYKKKMKYKKKKYHDDGDVSFHDEGGAPKNPWDSPPGGVVNHQAGSGPTPNWDVKFDQTVKQFE